MTTITWKGEEGTPVNEWYGIAFPAGVPVEITQAIMPNGVAPDELIERARGNRFFEVSDEAAGVPKPPPPPPKPPPPPAPEPPPAMVELPPWAEREQSYLPNEKPMKVKRRPGRPRKVEDT